LGIYYFNDCISKVKHPDPSHSCLAVLQFEQMHSVAHSSQMIDKVEEGIPEQEE
jgi:hypothetical protein